MPSFDPIIGIEPRLLILGSMPSVTSLEQRQYYAHPRNAFWWLMSELLQTRFDVDYEARVGQLKCSGVALWDVLYDCERPGSLDSRIVRSSERPNNIEGLLNDYPSIRVVGFNGGAAKAIFQRHFSHIAASCIAENNASPTLLQLPSTSPAHASISRQAKLDLWRNALGDVLSD